MPIDWGNNGYVQVSEEGAETRGEKLKRTVAGLNEAPDPRLLAITQQPKPKSALRQVLEHENRIGYVQEGGGGPSLVARAVDGMQSMNEAKVIIQTTGSGLTLGGIFEALNASPGATEGQQINEAVRQARVKAGAELRAKKKINNAVRRFERGEAVANGKHKAYGEYLAGRGYEQGKRNIERAEAVEAKIHGIGDGIGQMAQTTKEKVGQVIFSFGRWVSSRRSSPNVVDSEFSKE